MNTIEGVIKATSRFKNITVREGVRTLALVSVRGEGHVATSARAWRIWEVLEAAGFEAHVFRTSDAGLYKVLVMS